MKKTTKGTWVVKLNGEVYSTHATNWEALDFVGRYQLTKYGRVEVECWQM